MTHSNPGLTLGWFQNIVCTAIQHNSSKPDSSPKASEDADKKIVLFPSALCPHNFLLAPNVSRLDWEITANTRPFCCSKSKAVVILTYQPDKSNLMGMFSGQEQAAKSKVLGWQSLNYLTTSNANIKSGIADHLVESYELRIMRLELKQ